MESRQALAYWQLSQSFGWQNPTSKIHLCYDFSITSLRVSPGATLAFSSLHMTHPNTEIATQLHRVSDLLIERDLSDAARTKIQKLAQELVEVMETGAPISLAERTERFVKQMSVTSAAAPISDGDVFPSFLESPYSGSINALAPQRITYRRDGEAVAASVQLGTALEGRPGRAHGGAIAAVFDDAMGAMQRIIGRNGYTRSLTTVYHAPFPTDVEVAIRVICTGVDGPLFTIEATAMTGDRLVASATGTFVEIDVDRWTTG